MSMVKINFSKISKMKQQAIHKIGCYAIVSLLFLILSVYAIFTYSIELFIAFSFFDSIFWLIVGWNFFTYRSLTILETVIEKID